MAIAEATISTNVWDTFRGYLNHSSVTNHANILSAYAKSFTKDGSNKDFVVIYKPSISEVKRTFTLYEYPISIDIEIVCSEEEQMKVISDAVRARIDANRSSARSDGLFDMLITADETTSELRDKVRILHTTMTVEAVWRGAG